MKMRLRGLIGLGLGAGVLGVVGASASASDIVFQNAFDNGFFTPFNSGTSPAIRYGDSGWLSTGSGDPIALAEITLGLIVSGTSGAGTTDITFTFNDGDPSGLVFGPGTTLYSTTITGVELPAVDDGFVGFFLTIPLPGVVTSGGFNNVGWSVGVDNFSYDAEFGFMAATAGSQTAGFYTNNASFFNGTNWSLFSFGADPNFGVANFVATITQVPTPGAALLLALGGLAGARRRR